MSLFGQACIEMKDLINGLYLVVIATEYYLYIDYFLDHNY